METRPPNKNFWMVPFTIQATQGLLRDRRSRRVIMAISLGLTILLILCGVTLFSAWLDPHEHPWRFVLYWLMCGWQTLLALLLALLDILMLRAEARDARKALREETLRKDGSGE
jgi:protein-S-isoprenylcysteine O-methyltransferase Ste14